MRITKTLFLLTLLLASVATAKDRRELTQSIPVAPDQAVRVDFPVGELKVEGYKGDEVLIELLIECRWDSEKCAEALEELEVNVDSSSTRVLIEVEGYPTWGKSKFDIEGDIRVPQNREFELDMGVGEVEVRGLEDDIEIDLGVGEAKVWVAHGKVNRVNLDAGVGEVELRGTEEPVAEQRSMRVGGEVYWDKGKGDARIAVDVGVGQATVWLE